VELACNIVLGGQMISDRIRFLRAVHDFQSAQQKAAIQDILARITGRPNHPLSYEEVAEKLKLKARAERGVKTIPLDAIIGSVGRYAEYTRDFLPLRPDDQERWARVKTVFMESNANLDPIEVYKVGEVYFVADGNHRVSIARQEGLISIEAHVIELKTDIPLTPDIQPDDLIIKAEYAEFLVATRIMDLRPNVDLNMTGCSQYEKLMEQVRVCQYILQESQKVDASISDAACYWYDTMYIPLTEAIRDRGLLHWFPKQTITDLYLWISENRSALERDLGWDIQSDITATDLILKRNQQSETGSWRKARIVARYTDHLFLDILVPLSGEAVSWNALQQAIHISQREGSKIHGLHIVNSPEKINASSALAIQAEFNRRCAEAGVNGSMVIEAGEIAQKISARSTTSDLVVLKLDHPPQSGLSVLRSPFRNIIAQSSRPLLCIPEQASQFRRALLACDGSPQSREALFMATYLAEMWQTELIVISANKGTRQITEAQEYAQRYLDIHEIQAEYYVLENEPISFLTNAANDLQVDLILMGGGQGSVLQQIISGSLLDHTLREASVPIFICH
jgi:nucleotide-binding universal stress UspA family protein